MVAANVIAAFKCIIQPSVSRDVVTDTFNTPEELDVIIVTLWFGCVGNLFSNCIVGDGQRINGFLKAEKR